jgi:hypothetical protein
VPVPKSVHQRNFGPIPEWASPSLHRLRSGSYIELLINASSSNSSAHLYAYLPDGTYLGEVQNGGGGRYGGTVFVTLHIPATITIISSAGGSTTVPCVPGQI